jgi:RNA recognition motif-containing protein
MVKKKSVAQIRRMQERAAKRGETYEYTAPEPAVDDARDEINKKNTSTSDKGDSEDDSKLRDISIRLKAELKKIEGNAELKSKDRRGAKRKVEAIAAEESGISAKELLKWLENNPDPSSTSTEKDKLDPEAKKKRGAAKKLQKAVKEIDENTEIKSKDRRNAKRKAEAIASEESGVSAEVLLAWYKNDSIRNENKNKKKQSHDPYIAFIGQLSFNTSEQQLEEHIRSNLKTDFPKISSQKFHIRLLTDSKTKKSRGMAFCQVDDPEILYALLKLHQTFLNGRRINVERSAGGKKNSTIRKTKLQQYRKDQSEYFSEVVDNILSEYRKTGELRDDELDDGVIALCKRHAGPVVRAAVSKYVEGSGRDMDNPSAYLTFLVTKFAEEGVYDEDENKPKHSQKPKRKQRSGGGGKDFSDKRLRVSSEFAKFGVDMSASQGTSDISKIFPSARRGRGYMM